MRPLLFPTLGLSKEEVQLITDVYDKLRPSHPEAEFEFDFSPDLSCFEAIRGYYSELSYGPILRLDNGDLKKYLCFLHLTYCAGGGRYTSGTHYECQPWGISFLKRKYGHILIRPETFLDKVRELLHHTELNFEDDKGFSKAYFVLSNDEEKARALLQPRLRQIITELPLKDFVIEIVDNVLLVGDNKWVDPGRADEIAASLYRVSAQL